MTVYTRPRAKARPRMSRNGHVYTPKETKEYEELIAAAWRRHQPGLMFTGPIRVTLRFTFKRPKSHLLADGSLKPNAPPRYCNTPDLDNIEKAVLDALNKVAYTDDKYIYDKLSVKEWGKVDSVTVIIDGLATRQKGLQL